MADEPVQRGPTAAKNVIMDRFESSGNMSRMFGSDSNQDVAVNSAQVAKGLAEEQDRTHRGSSPQAQPNPEPQPEHAGGPEGHVRVGSEQRREVQEDQRVPLRRLNQEIAKRKELEAQLQSLQENRQLEPQQPQQSPLQTPPEGFEADDPLVNHLVNLTKTVQDLQGKLSNIQSQSQMSELTRYFNGDGELANLVNEIWRNGQAGLTVDESYMLTKARFPEVFARGGDDLQGGPAGYTESPSRDPDLSRQMPEQVSDRDSQLKAALGSARNQAERVQIGRDLLKGRLYKS